MWFVVTSTWGVGIFFDLRRNEGWSFDELLSLTKSLQTLSTAEKWKTAGVGCQAQYYDDCC